MPKTQQVATASLALDQSTLREHSDTRTGDHVVIGSTDGKKDTPKKIFVEISSPERLIEFKLLGVIRGSTPTAIAIAEIGRYKRKLMEETNYGVLSKNWEKKLALCLEAQTKLLALEQKELQVDFTDDAARHQFMSEVKDILTDAINQNKIECSGITHREGRLESQFIKGIHELEENFERAFSQHVLSSGDQTQAVPAYFSPADQLGFDMQKPMAIDLTEHLSDTEACNFLEYYYHTRQNLQQITLTNDGFKRSGLFSKSQDKASFFLNARRSFLSRLSYNTKLSTKVIWSFLKQPVMDVKTYLKKQGKALSHSVFDAQLEVHIQQLPLTEKTPSTEHQTVIQDLSKKLDAALKEGPAEQTRDHTTAQASATALIDSAWVKPAHQIIVQDQYDNFLAQILYVLKNNLKKFDTLSKSHEVIALAISMGGAASLLVIFKAGLIHGALKSAIKNFFHANQMNAYETVARPLHTMDYFSKLISLGSDISGGNLESLVKKFEDPIVAVELIAASIAHGINLDLAAHPDLEASQSVEKAVDSSETMAVRLEQVDSALATQERTVEEKEQADMLAKIQLIQAQSLMLLAHNLDNKKKEIIDKKPPKTSFLGAAVLLGLRPIFAVLKPIVAFSAAGLAAVQLKSSLPLQMAAYEWKNRLKQGAKKLGLMAIDFSDAFSKGMYDLAAFCVRTPVKGSFTIVRKVLGTTNDLLVGASHLFGFKQVQKTPIKTVIRGLVATEDFLVNKLGGLLRKTRQGIGKGFNVIRHLIAPNGPIERLELAAKTLQTCEQALRYQQALIQKHAPLIQQKALCDLLSNKIQLITDLTRSILTQTKHYQQSLMNNNNPEDIKKYGESLKSNLLKALAEFDANIAQHNLSLDLSRVASKQERLADTALEQRRHVLSEIIEQIPSAAPAQDQQQSLVFSEQPTNALFEKESIKTHLPKSAPAVDQQQAVLEKLHAEFKQGIEQGSRRALR